MTIMIGIDPHKATHTAVAINDEELVLDEFTLRASKVQASRLCDWVGRFDNPLWAVESANGLGYLLAQQLVAAGETVFDVSPMLASRVRVLGSGRSQKNDTNDARSVAIAALRSDRPVRVRPDDHCRVLRLLVKRHRDMAQLRAKHRVRLHVLLCELEAGGIGSTITASKEKQLLTAVPADDTPTQYRLLIAEELIADIATLDTTPAGSKKRITIAVAASGPSLCDIYGVGPIGAAHIIGHLGDISRLRTNRRGHPVPQPDRGARLL